LKTVFLITKIFFENKKNLLYIKITAFIKLVEADDSKRVLDDDTAANTLFAISAATLRSKHFVYYCPS
jgi:hypothetical protein